MRKYLSSDEILSISNSLEDYHKIFYTFFELSNICFDDSIKTAAVCFPKNQKPLMLINEIFWNSLNDKEKHFIICHECLHVLLHHGIRNGKNVKGSTNILVNIAQDITINEMIVDMFNFDRVDLREWKKYCWIDTCFEHPVLVKRNETFIYYLELLIKQSSNSSSFIKGELLDEHGDPNPDNMNEFPIDDLNQNELDDLISKIGKDLSKEELEKLSEQIFKNQKLSPAGDMPGCLQKMLDDKVKFRKLNFQAIVKGLKRSRMKKEEKDIETFKQDDRRFSDILAKNTAISLPAKILEERYKKDKIHLAIFMDVSGSCVEYLPTFEKIIATFKEETHLFDLDLYTFDTCVAKIDQKLGYRYGGGTSFSIIEDECMNIENTTKKYPDGVLVITDGEGCLVEPKYSNRWIWLMTKNYTERYVPKKSKVYPLSHITFNKE